MASSSRTETKSNYNMWIQNVSILLSLTGIDFLATKKGSALIDRSCNKVQLIPKGSQSIYFKVLPRYKYRQEGEKVQYRDQIILMNTKTNLYLHMSDEWIRPEPVFKFPREPWRAPEADRRVPPFQFIERLEVNASTSYASVRVLPHLHIN